LVNEKAKSKSQQRFMGMVRAAQKGEKPASKKIAKVAKSMDPEDVKDYATTKHKGKPERVKKEELIKFIRNEIKNLQLEKVASPMINHLNTAKNEIRYMVEEGPLEEEGVYDKPKEAMKLLNIAQKALGKIK